MTKLTSLSLFVLFTSAMGLTLSAGCGGGGEDRNPGASGSGNGASGGSAGSSGGSGTTGGSTGTSGGTGGGSGGSTGGSGGGVEPACTRSSLRPPSSSADFT